MDVDDGGIKVESNTIRLHPIPPTVAEPEIYQFLMKTLKAPPVDLFKSIRMDKNGMQSARAVLANGRDCKLCIRELSGKELDGAKVTISMTEQVEDWNRQFKGSTRYIKITGLSQNVKEKDIAKHIKSNGGIQKDIEVKDVMLRHHSSMRSYPGFGYVDCGSSVAASLLVEKLNMTKLKGNRGKIWVTWVMWRDPVHAQAFNTTVWLKKIHHSMTRKDLRGQCERFGDIKKLKLAEMDGYRMNEATVVMRSRDDAQALCNGLNGHEVGGLAIVAVGRASKATRKAQGNTVEANSVMAYRDKSFFGTKEEKVRKWAAKQQARRKQRNREVALSKGKMERRGGASKFNRDRSSRMGYNSSRQWSRDNAGPKTEW